MIRKNKRKDEKKREIGLIHLSSLIIESVMQRRSPPFISPKTEHEKEERQPCRGIYQMKAYNRAHAERHNRRQRTVDQRRQRYRNKQTSNRKKTKGEGKETLRLHFWV
jgi:hypothetical protein